jgi:hypothetical protein
MDLCLDLTEGYAGDPRICRPPIPLPRLNSFDRSTTFALARTSPKVRKGDCRGDGKGPAQGLTLPLRFSIQISTILLEMAPCLSSEHTLDVKDDGESNSASACLICSREKLALSASETNVGVVTSSTDSDETSSSSESELEPSLAQNLAVKFGSTSYLWMPLGCLHPRPPRDQSLTTTSHDPDTIGLDPLGPPHLRRRCQRTD